MAVAVHAIIQRFVFTLVALSVAVVIWITGSSPLQDFLLSNFHNLPKNGSGIAMIQKFLFTLAALNDLKGLSTGKPNCNF